MNKVVATFASVLASATAPALAFVIIMLVLGRSEFNRLCVEVRRN